MSATRTARKIVVQPMPVAARSRKWVNWVYPPPQWGMRYLGGCGVMILGVLLILVLFGILGALGSGDLVPKDALGGSGEHLAKYALAVGGGMILLIVFRFARRLRSRHALNALKRDPRPPILLLRAFSDDYHRLPDFKSELPLLSIAWVTRTFEEYLQQKLHPVGPVIAIGRPGESIPPLGALRFWVADDKWQEVILELLGESQYIVMLMGNLSRVGPQNPFAGVAVKGRQVVVKEDGLTWEVYRVFELNELRKVILLMPPVPEPEAKQRWEHYRTLSNHRLPPFEGGEVGVVFDAQGEAWVLRGGGVRNLASYDAILDVKV